MIPNGYTYTSRTLDGISIDPQYPDWRKGLSDLWGSACNPQTPYPGTQPSDYIPADVIDKMLRGSTASQLHSKKRLWRKEMKYIMSPV
jgi:hypothetical protein